MVDIKRWFGDDATLLFFFLLLVVLFGGFGYGKY